MSEIRDGKSWMMTLLNGEKEREPYSVKTLGDERL